MALPNGNPNFLTVGNGIVYIGTANQPYSSFVGTDVGYISNDVTWEPEKKLLDKRVGLPLQLVQSVTIQESVLFMCEFAELSAANISHILGEDPITTVSGSQVTVTAQVLTTAIFQPASGLYAAKLDGPNVATSPAVVVTNTAGSTTYTNGTDYIVDYTNGAVVLVPTTVGGTITPGQQIKVTYKYTPAASHQVKVGANFSITPVGLLFIHTRPETGKFVKTFVPQARANGKVSVKFHEQAWTNIPITFEAIPDTTNNPTCPLGLVDMQD